MNINESGAVESEPQFSMAKHTEQYERLNPHTETINEVLTLRHRNETLAADPDLTRQFNNNKSIKSNEERIQEALTTLSTEGISEQDVEYYNKAKSLQHIETTINNIEGFRAAGSRHTDDQRALQEAWASKTQLENELAGLQE